MKLRTVFFLLAASALVTAGPATAASACLGLVCTQGIVDTYPTIWSYGNVEVCEQNIRVGVAGGEQQTCSQQMFSCAADNRLNVSCGRPGSGGPSGPPGAGEIGGKLGDFLSSLEGAGSVAAASGVADSPDCAPDVAGIPCWAALTVACKIIPIGCPSKCPPGTPDNSFWCVVIHDALDRILLAEIAIAASGGEGMLAPESSASSGGQLECQDDLTGIPCWLVQSIQCKFIQRVCPSECPPGTPDNTFWCAVLRDVVDRLLLTETAATMGIPDSALLAVDADGTDCRDDLSGGACWLVESIECRFMEKVCPGECPPGTPPGSFWCNVLREIIDEAFPAGAVPVGSASSDASQRSAKETVLPVHVLVGESFCYWYWQNGTNEMVNLVGWLSSEVVNATCRSAYVYVWYYPPGPYQAYCFLKAQTGEECPTPDPGSGEPIMDDLGLARMDSARSSGAAHPFHIPGHGTMCYWYWHNGTNDFVNLVGWVGSEFVNAQCLTAYIFIWHYPPGVYQVYCLAQSQIGGDCPVADPGDGGRAFDRWARFAAGPSGSPHAFHVDCQDRLSDTPCWTVETVECSIIRKVCPSQRCPPGAPDDNFWCEVLRDVIGKVARDAAAADSIQGDTSAEGL